ncbi:hypothetical protein [Paenibacillus aquistagni]|uniref:hypothetical protein n=1 Tax=Paenibacillus aquistagni TaxID=1852522 RepID=UPI0011302A23|nr:hypothetical protein [Paenibacillus aquistagni]
MFKWLQIPNEGLVSSWTENIRSIGIKEGMCTSLCTLSSALKSFPTCLHDTSSYRFGGEHPAMPTSSSAAILAIKKA